MSIALDQVTKRYHAAAVVNDVSLEIRDGEFLVLLGPSGSGKSTLLRAIAGLVDIDHGRVSLHGRDVTRLPARERGVGFVFQHYALFRHMNVADNIEFALRVRRVRAAERRRRRAELLRLVALEGMDDRLPAELSGGQQQRVAVARALAHNPEVLLLDEPFGALDAKIREELRRTIRSIQRALGITTILVTHDQDEAFAMADRIGVMHQGRLLECGRPDDLYARPSTRFVATFLGAVNLVLGYRAARSVRFEQPAPDRVAPREVVAVIRPEEIDFTAAGMEAGITPLGNGVVEEIQFAGATQRLRIRVPQAGPLSAVPLPDVAAAGWLLEAWRTVPQQRAHPLAIGDRVAVGARRVHVLPTPISSFTALAANAADAAALESTPLLAALAERMQARVFSRTAPDSRVPPGLPVIGAGAHAAEAALALLRRGARQLLILPAGAQPPSRIVVMADEDARTETIGVTASLLRHFTAESTLLAVHGADTPESQRAFRMRELLDLRSATLAAHGFDPRTEVRYGDADTELAKELAADPGAMLVLGVGAVEGRAAQRLAALLDGGVARPALIVRASAAGD